MKHYRFFYAADIITVVAKDPLGPLSRSYNNIVIDRFESVVLDERTNHSELESLFGESYKEDSGDDLLAAFDPDPPPKPKPSPSGGGDTPGIPTQYGTAWMYGGARFEENFLLYNQIYKNLGLLIDSDLANLRNKVTFRRYRTFSAAASLEIFSEASFKMRPQDPKNISKNYGLVYSTYLPYAGRKLFADVRSVIEGITYNVGTDESPIIYEVIPETVKPRRLKTYNPL
jgi:hypothetical protein